MTANESSRARGCLKAAGSVCLRVVIHGCTYPVGTNQGKQSKHLPRLMMPAIAVDCYSLEVFFAGNKNSFGHMGIGVELREQYIICTVYYIDK